MNVLMRPAERPRQNAGNCADARGTRPTAVEFSTRSTRLIQNAERSSVYSVVNFRGGKVLRLGGGVKIPPCAAVENML
jgi:hypothetical protein